MSTNLVLPIGNRTLAIDFTKVNNGEGRLHEIAFVNNITANELCSFFNSASQAASFEIGKVEYEIAQAQKSYDLAKAEVILDKAPLEAVKLKDLGMKPNDAWRDALIVRDAECSKWKDLLSQLESIKSLLSAKLKSFERAYYVCYKEKENKRFLPDSSTQTRIGETYNQPQNNFMGGIYMPPQEK